MAGEQTNPIETINREWNEFKGVLATAVEEQKKYGKTLGDTDAKLDAINARLDEMEMRAKRPAVGANKTDGKSKTSPEQKAAFVKFAKKGVGALTPEEVKFLSLSDDSSGGFLASDELVQEIIKDIVLFSPVRSYARIRQTSKRSVKVRKRTQVPAAVWVGAERTTKSETQNPKYGLEEIPNHELYAFCDISVQDLEDSDFDIEAEIRMDAGEQFGVSEGSAFVNGSGVGQPEGLMVAANVGADVTGDANLITYNGLVDVSHNLKSGYAANASFFWNRKTLGKIRKLTDSQNRPLWAPMDASSPATVLGLPYAEFPDMPDVAANAYPVICGDLKRAYLVVDRVQMSVLRDDVTQAAQGAVRLIIRKRVGGQVINPNAFRKLQIHT